MADEISIAWLAQQLSDRTTRGIALGTTALIRAGAIPVGAKLPPVRDLADALGVSPATISSAWGALRKQRVIIGRGRNGAWVNTNDVTPRPIRFETPGNFGEHLRADLSLAVPDPALLPDLSHAFAAGAKVASLNVYERAPIVPALRAAAERHWPYPAPAYLAVNGGFSGVHLTLKSLLLPGSVVAVEDPTAARVLDNLDHLGAEVVPVACDAEGPLPDSLAAALAKRPAAFFYQPRTHSVTGVSVSTARFEALRRLLLSTDLLIVEDDGLGALSSAPPLSMGCHFPERTIHITSYSKAFGPDLRVGVLSGPVELVRQIHGYRNFSDRWTSRILQEAMAFLLTDTQCLATVERARGIYAQRRQALVAALAQRGVDCPAGDGLAIWLPVPSEPYALVTMAAHGYAVGAGSRNSLLPGRAHLRIGTSRLESESQAIADALCLCCHNPDT
ncbi:Transcriptional regulator, GntR family / Aspartate aminotransferase [Herbaspirillum rubrisubalbicans M1]|uniref:aminotransferase class I/II-fold pyridoxal phosphate-dependent enzyme n=1 Tax=Herbaspirillum rubrisubalbicans TaxID=80842 RepID=UPI00073A19CB|nr:aminotransferase class I/II-fold pyridoxal phosphate-dependent enzyme [Herbaspirillum rubrisubalbicans]ALU89829.1 Transcriptional regulator, GntR family / Aspartate aminotransferase [Herbaspirillum rubrisubalbicans M1]